MLEEVECNNSNIPSVFQEWGLGRAACISLPSEGREVVFNRPSVQVKHIKIKNVLVKQVMLIIL